MSATIVVRVSDHEPRHRHADWSAGGEPDPVGRHVPGRPFVDKREQRRQRGDDERVARGVGVGTAQAVPYDCKPFVRGAPLQRCRGIVRRAPLRRCRGQGDRRDRRAEIDACASGAHRHLRSPQTIGALGQLMTDQAADAIDRDDERRAGRRRMRAARQIRRERQYHRPRRRCRDERRSKSGHRPASAHIGWYTLAHMTSPSGRHLAAVALVSAALLMTELALTRIFSVVMYYHFAFLAISVALFGVSASGVFAYLTRPRLERWPTDTLLAAESVIYAGGTIVALFWLVRLRVGLNYSPHNLALMLAIYALAALPFFAGGLVVTLAISRLSSRINAVYAADLMGAAAGCLMLIPMLDRLGAPGVVLAAAALSI